ncbi:MAG: ferritin family protein [Syntrophomonadaceae bacterium]|jgi:rubrerythrin|nr:ferritin family protein [Syntrophomonadaceae bacterium]
MGWSITKFSGEEIIEIAIQMEESGKLFYEKAKSLAEGDNLKDVLTYLAQEEEKHVQDFSKLGQSINYSFLPNEKYPGEYEEYVRSLVNSHIFKLTEVDDLIKGIKNDKDILQMAISFEKDSIVFFQELKNMGNKTASGMLEKLIDEERGHIKKIVAILKDM